MNIEISRQIFDEILLVDAELFHEGRTGGRTDMMRLIVAFRNLRTRLKI
jgi:hypothetical protein